ncbi:hypothetical protein [Streptomyces sp. NPDC047000]|uniref:hypothetical protein n=1 Tax=Streptomyces sp. NPDC047000 TaxID=3155474 RepID=UPI003403ECF3
MASMQALLTAAGASPGTRHRWASVGYLLQQLLTAPPTGWSSAKAVTVGGLLDACRREAPWLAGLEDFVPSDPRQVVLTRLGDEVLRLAPGQVERPLADITRWKTVAQATDSVLVPELGFGISEYVEVGLRYADLAIRALASSWPDGDVPTEGPAKLTDQELAAAEVLLSMPVEAMVAPSETLRAALNWATAQQAEPIYDPRSPQSTFGRYLAVSHQQSDDDAARFWLPLGFLPESLGQGVVDLARHAASSEANVSLRFAQLAAERARRALWRFSDKILGPPDTSSGPAVSPRDVVQWVVMFGPARALLVQLFARPHLQDAQLREEPAARRISRHARAHPDEEVRVPLPGGSLTLPAGTEIVPLLLVASAGHLVAPQRPGLAAMSLEDLLWASTTADSDTDLYTFCRELAAPNRPHMIVWEAIDLWEWWRGNNKTFFSGGRAPDLMMVSPHHSAAEWERGERLQELEQALALLALPGIDSWDALDPIGQGPYGIYEWCRAHVDEQSDEVTRSPEHDRPDLYGWRVRVGTPAVAVRSAHPAWGDDHHQLLHDLAGSYVFGFEQLNDAWNAVHDEASPVGYVLEMRPVTPDERDRAESIRVGSVEAQSSAYGLVIHAEFLVDCELLAEQTDRDVATTREVMAQTIRSLLEQSDLPPSTVDTVATAWRVAPPTLAIRIMTAPVSRPHLARPWPVDAHLVGMVDQEVARAVQAAGVAPGTYVGPQAKELDRGVLAPAALDALNRRLAQHSSDDLVTVGMRQIERTLATKNQQFRDLEQSSRLLSVAWDPLERQTELEQEHLWLRRSNEIAIEAALRAQPTGNRRVDQYAWMEITAAASAYLAATMRSEAIHHQVRPTGLRISDAYEITVVTDLADADADADAGSGSAGSRVFDLDLSAFRRARAAHMLAAPATLGSHEQTDEVDAAAEVVDEEQIDELVDPAVDAAMLAAYGASVSDILQVLFSMAHWPLEPDDPDAVAVPADTVRQHLLDTLRLADEPDGHARIAAAQGLLTSTSAALQAADWKPWHARSRQKRLVVQPLAELTDGRLVVGPQLCYASAGIYGNFVAQGILPWTQPPPPRRVTDALEAVRDRKNRALETEVAQTLRAAGYMVEERIREQDPQRLGVPSLQTEIDVVAGRAADSVIWLIEVKDPADVHVTPEIRRHLDRFYVDHRKPCYATQLQRKLDDLAPRANEVAAALGLPTSAEPRVVRAIFVTRAPVPAGFVGGPFTFHTLRDLAAALDGATSQPPEVTASGGTSSPSRDRR